MNKIHFTCVSIGVLIGKIIFGTNGFDTTILLIMFWGFWYVLDYLQDILNELRKGNID